MYNVCGMVTLSLPSAYDGMEGSFGATMTLWEYAGYLGVSLVATFVMFILIIILDRTDGGS